MESLFWSLLFFTNQPNASEINLNYSTNLKISSIIKVHSRAPRSSRKKKTSIKFPALFQKRKRSIKLPALSQYWALI